MKPDVLWGATYFSAWNDGNKQVVTMNHPDWYARAPFYAELISRDPYQLRISSERQAVIDQEILYASSLGLDYWAFYSTSQSQDDRDRFLRSPYRSQMRWCQIQGWFGGEEGYFKTRSTEDEIAHLVRLFGDRQYLRVLGDRPLFYWFTPNGKYKRSPVGVFGSEPAAHAFFDALRAASITAGTGDPYVVVLSFNVATGREFLEAIGGDAVSSYAVFGETYAETLDFATRYWEHAKELQVPLVPPFGCGWGGPHVKAYGGKPPHGDTAQPSMLEWRKMLLSAEAFVGENPDVCPSRAVLIYNWSEYGEGGWLNADKVDGPNKLLILDALKEGQTAAIPWNFTFTTEGWTSIGISGFGLSPKHIGEDRALIGTAERGVLPMLISPDDLDLVIDELPRVVIRLKNQTSATRASIDFRMRDSDAFSAGPVEFTLKANDPDFTEYDINMRAHPQWRGFLSRFRIAIEEPAEGAAPLDGAIGVQSVRLEPAIRTPAQPRFPFPVDGATAESTVTDLAWLPSDGAVDYEVYLGTSDEPPLLGRVAGTTYELGHLDPATTYFWRIAARNGGRSATGPTWRFTTNP